MKLVPVFIRSAWGARRPAAATGVRRVLRRPGVWLAAAGLGLWAYWLAKPKPLTPPAPVHVELAAMSAAELAALPFDRLIRDDVLRALEAAIVRHRQTVQGYTCLMAKRERVGSKLRDAELVRCWYRVEPPAVMMEWLEGKDQAEASLWASGENLDKLLVRPASAWKLKALRLLDQWYAARSPGEAEVRSASRYSVIQFGLGAGMERTYAAWKKAQDAGRLRVRYEGLKPTPELDNKLMHLVVRDVDPPEEDGLTRIVTHFDPETWIQVGTEIYRNDEVIGRYFFRDVELNAEIEPGRFKPEILKK